MQIPNGRTPARQSPLSSPPDEDEAPRDGKRKNARDSACRQPLPSVPAGGEPEDTEIPFEGLVNEVLKWGGGEIVLVRREDREGDIPEEIVPPAE